MQLTRFTYELPQNRIAQSPACPRDSAKLLIINRQSKQLIHKFFIDISNYLDKNDVLVFNNTKVFPARLYGKKTTGGKIEVLLLREKNNHIWEALTSPGVRLNQKIIFGGKLSGEILSANNESGIAEIKLPKHITKAGVTPLPPYIHTDISEIKLRKLYQTVYARINGSVAAPTAGFHFTDSLLKKLRTKGVSIEFVTLHVGPGTFLPVKHKSIEEHKMHAEIYNILPETAGRLMKAKSQGKRIISVGTTTTRVLEAWSETKKISGSTDIYIYPPYKFKFVDGLITNFHLPHSTLLMLVSAFVSFPNIGEKFVTLKNSLIGKAYREAIKKNYRFYSFGDASLII